MYYRNHLQIMEEIKINFEALSEFFIQYKKDLQRIAYKSKNAYEVQEVMSEVVMTADSIERTTNQKIDFSNPAHQTQIIAYTYQRLVHYDDGKIRHASSLDTPLFDNNKSSFNDILPAQGVNNPEDTLIDLKQSQNHQSALMNKGSAKIAWVDLVDNCGNNMVRVASYLKLSHSHTYRCFNKVVRLATLQLDLALNLPESSEPTLSPWIKSRIYREPVQLSLQLNYKTCLFGHLIKPTNCSQNQETKFVRY